MLVPASGNQPALHLGPHSSTSPFLSPVFWTQWPLSVSWIASSFPPPDLCCFLCPESSVPTFSLGGLLLSFSIWTNCHLLEKPAFISQHKVAPTCTLPSLLMPTMSFKDFWAIAVHNNLNYFVHAFVQWLTFCLPSLKFNLHGNRLIVFWNFAYLQKSWKNERIVHTPYLGSSNVNIIPHYLFHYKCVHTHTHTFYFSHLK